MKLLNRISAATQAPPVCHALTSYPAHIARAYSGTPMNRLRPRRCLPAVLVALALSCLASATAMAQSGPTFDSGLVNQNYTVGATIVNLTLPGANGGTGTLAYTLMPDANTAIPGLTFDATARTLAGTPTTPSAAAVALTYTVTDANSMTDNLTFMVTVHSAPTLATGVPPQRYTARQEVAVTLPVGSGGFGTLSYTLTRIGNGDPVGPGLTFYAEDRAIRGTPTQGFATTPAELRYTVLDANGGGTFAPFTMRVFNVPELSPIGPQHYTVGTAVNLALAATGGFPPLTYTLTSTSSIPGWMQLDTIDRTIGAITGTPDAASTFELTVAVTDVSSITTEQTFMVTVHSAPTFADDTTIPNQVYTARQSVALTLPAASGGGFGTLSYVLTRTNGGPSAPIVAPGLTAFDPETRIISGTTSQAYGGDGGAELRYTVWDANGASATRIDFTMRTVAAPTFSTTIADQNFTVGTEVNTVLPTANDGITPLIYTLTPVPDTVIPGLTFVAGSSTLTGTPTTASVSAVALTYTVTDANSVTTAQTFTVTVSNELTFAGAANVPDQRYTVGQSVAVTLPLGSGGLTPLSYTLTRISLNSDAPVLVDDLDFYPEDRAIRGIPMTGFGTTTPARLLYTVLDANGTAAMIEFSLQVANAPLFPTIADQNYTVGTAVNLALAVTSGGFGTLTYTLTPDASIPNGLSFNPGAATLTGTPDVASPAAVELTVTVTDANGITAEQPFTVTVSNELTFAGAANVPDQRYTVGQSVAVTLPLGSGGFGTLSYTLTRISLDSDAPVLVDDLDFYPEDRAIRGIPMTGFGTTTPARLLYTVLDANGTAAMIEFSLQVANAPTLPAIDDQNYTVDTAVNLALAVTSGGFSPLTYTLTSTSSIPGWLNLHPTTGAITGTPDAASTAVELTAAVTDVNSITTEQTFMVTVHSAPTFADTTTIPNQVYTARQSVALTLPAASGGGFGTLSYVLTRTDGGPSAPIVAPGLTAFDPETRIISGTTSQAYGPANLRYTVWDANGASTTRIDFTMRTVAAPTFSTTIADQNFTVGTEVNTVLPTANDGITPLIYTLTPVPDTVIPGLTFVAGSSTLTGTPTTASVSAVALTYTVTDANSVTTAQTFTVTVSNEPLTFAGAANVPDQRYTVGQSVAVTLPLGSGGFGTLSYTLTRISLNSDAPVLVDDLDFYPEDRAIRGIPMTGFGTTTPARLLYTVLDANGTTAMIEFSLQVANAPLFPTIADQNYTVGTAVNLALAVTSGGFGTLTYTLTPDASIPNGLSFNPGAATLTGTPDVASPAAVELTVTVTDANGITAEQPFMVTVYNALTLASTVPNQIYTVRQVVAVTLPLGSGGIGTLSYTLTRTGGTPGSPVVEPGLTFDPVARTISGTTTRTFGGTNGANLHYTVLDASGAFVTHDFTMRVFAAPTFTSTITDKNYAVGTEVSTVLPDADDGITPLIYALMPDPDPAIPGLTFVAGSRTLTGTPTTVATAVALTYTVTDANSVTTAQTFMVTVFGEPNFTEIIDDQVYTIGDSVAVTLPIANDGLGTLTYTLARTDGGSPTLPDGLIFDPTARSIEGSPSAGFGGSDGASMRYTATDTIGTDVALTFTMQVFGIDTTTIDDQNYYTETAVNLTLPGASGGTGTLSFTLIPAVSIPAGLTFDPDTRTLTGTPTTPKETAVTLIYTARDANGRTNNRTFMVTVYSALIFTDTTTVPNQIYTVDQVVAVTLPLGSGGSGTLSYTLTRISNDPTAPVVAPGLTFYPEDLAIRGTTRQGFGTTTPANLRYTVLDANGTSTSVTFTMQVLAAPAFTATITNQNFTAGAALNPLMLPTANNGVTPLSYTLTPDPDTAIPGLTFVAGSRTLTGTPTTPNETAALTYTVTDANDITAALTFTVTVFSAPTFAVIPEQVYSAGESVAVTLPQANDGAGSLNYALTRTDDTTPILPPGLTFDATARTLSGTPSEPFGDSDGISMRYTATDPNGSTGVATFTLRVFGFGTTTIDDQGYTVDIAVNLTLPAVGGGADPLIYTLTPVPDGLTFDATARTLTGIPTVGSTDATLTYAVTDANGLTDNLTFMVAFNAAALTVTSADVNEGDGTTSFTVRLINSASSNFSVSATIGGTATAGTGKDYTAVISQTLSFTGTAGETQTISVTILDDDLAEGPETLVLSLGTPQGTGVAVYSGFIGTITITDNDVATLTIANGLSGEPSASQPRHATVRVTLDTAVPGGFQVRLKTEDGTATAGEDYDAINTILTFNGNKGQTRAVETPILHDSTPELAEFFTASLSELTGTQASVDIRDTGELTIFLSDGGIVSFGDSEIANRVYLVDTDITPLILPEPIADEYLFNVEYFFQTPLPAGLSFDATTRTLSGRPTTVATTDLTYTARNFTIVSGQRLDQSVAFNSTSASLTFSVTITATGVGVLHYSDAAAATPITDLVSSGDVYSVVAFGTNVKNVDAQDTTARPAIAYSLGTDTDSPVQFGIVAHDAALASGECQAESATNTSRYTCRYSLEISGANAAVNDPGAYTVSVSAATVTASNVELAAYNQDSGVIIAVQPSVESVTFYSDMERNDVITSAATGDVIYMAVVFSENMENINGDPTGVVNLADVFGKPDINYWRKVGSTNLNKRRHFTIVAPDDELFELGDSCKAPSDTNTSEYFCQLVLDDTIEYFRVEVLQEGTRDLAGYPLVGVTLTADNKPDRDQMDVGYHTEDIPVVNAAAPMVVEIIHFSDEAGNTPISDDDVVSGGNIYSVIQFESQVFERTRNNPKISYQLGSAPPVALAINLASQPGPCVLIAFEAVTSANQRFRCRYDVGATAEGEYRIIVGGETRDIQGERQGTDYPSNSVSISALRFNSGTEIADQNYTVGNLVELSLPEGTHGVVGTLSYALTQDNGSPLTLPTGLTFDAEARTLIGTPTASDYDRTVRYTVMDGYGSSVPLRFTLRVFAVPVFDSIADQNYTVGVMVNRTLPAVSAAPPLIYTLTPTLAWLTFDAATHSIKGTPTTPSNAVTLTYAVTDANGFMAMQTFTVTVNAALVFDTATISTPGSAYTYTIGTTITSLTLPPTSGGTTPLTYTLTPTASIPQGLTFDAEARTLAGTPTTATAVVLTYAVTDAAAAAVSLTFMVTVNPIVPTAAPTDVTLTPGDTQISVSWTPVPEANNGGAEITGYTATATDTTDTTTTFPPCTATGAAATDCASPITGLMNGREYRVTVVATNIAGNSMRSTEVSATPTIFTFVTPSIADQSYTVSKVATFTLPEAIGGTGTLSYSLTPEADISAVGLTFAPTTRILSGTPLATGIRTLTYTVTDSNTPPVSITLTFSVKVSRVQEVIPGDVTPIMLDLDGDENTGAAGTLTLPTNHEVTEVALSTPPASATSNPPAGVEFNLTTDIALTLNADLAASAIVCLPTTGVPEDLVPTLYHYTSDTDTWDEIGRAAPGADIVCGETQTFSPFAVGVERPDVTIRDNIAADTANIAHGDVIFTITITFSEAVTKLEQSNIRVLGGISDTLAETGTGTGTYTLAVNPTNTNDGTISVTVLADAVTGQTNDNGNAEVTATQRYDTLAPAAPGINIVATDDIINRAEQTTTDLTGTNEAGATITLCFGGTNAACDGGGTSRTAADNVTVTGTTWSYTLIAADIAAMDQGPETLRATATDAAGNPAQATRAIFVDTVAPFFRSGITGEVAAHTNIEVIIYDANATNNRGDSENADDDITYTLPLTPDGGDNPNLFNIDEDSGVVRYNEVQTSATAAPHHNIIITATDRAGNPSTLTVIISVQDNPAVIITDSVTSEYTNAAVTFTFSFREGIKASELDGFTTEDIRVDGGDKGAFAATTPNERYTLVATPNTSTNDGVLTVTVRANAVTSTTTEKNNLEVVVHQKYDTAAPKFFDGDGNEFAAATAMATAFVNDSIDTVVYDTNAKDGSGAVDEGITYTLSGTNENLFNIDEDSGEVTYKVVQTSPTTDPHHIILITATDRVGNPDSIDVTVTAVFSSNSDLSALTVVASDGDPVQLTPAFAAATSAYTADVDQESVTITTTARPAATTVITGTAADDATALTVTGSPDTGTTVSGLTEGDNTITITVTAADGTAMSIYTITLTRAPILTVDTTTTTRLNEQILTRASQAMTAGTLEAVARRVDAAADGAASTAVLGATPALAYQFGGQSSLSGLLKSHGKAMLEDQMEYEQLFDGASFVVPLSATEGGTGGGKSGGGTLSLWGSSNFINLDSDNDGVDWDGQVTSINIGVDKLIGKEMLAGFALSSNQSSFDYVDAKAASDDAYRQGEYNYSNTILHPYIGWFPGEELKLWASVGFGSGEIEINIDTKDDVSSTDTTQQSLSGGFSRRLLNSTKQTSGNTTTLNLKGDVSMTSVDVEENLEAGFAAQEVSSSRLRVLVSGAQRRGLASGGGLTPSLEMGVRNDGGDGVTGTGVELGGGLRYANSGGNVAVAVNVRTLLAHDYTESGADLLLQRLPSAGRGLSLSLHPVWGKTQSVAEQLWNDGASEIAGEADSDTSPQSSLDAEVGYGVAASILGAPGVLTPYTGMTATDGDTSRLRLGSRFAGGNGLSLNLEGTRENTAGGASHIVLLRGEVSF